MGDWLEVDLENEEKYGHENDVTRQSCGCIHCDLGKKQFNQDGKLIHYIDMMRNLITPCTKPLT